jgi:hypothetical protein
LATVRGRGFNQRANSRQANPNESKENQGKNPCISLDSFGRIGAFQWVTAEKNKKFLLRLHSRHGLWAIAETAHARRLARAPPIVWPSFSLPGIIATISV